MEILEFLISPVVAFALVLPPAWKAGATIWDRAKDVSRQDRHQHHGSAIGDEDSASCWRHSLEAWPTEAIRRSCAAPSRNRCASRSPFEPSTSAMRPPGGTTDRMRRRWSRSRSRFRTVAESARRARSHIRSDVPPRRVGFPAARNGGASRRATPRARAHSSSYPALRQPGHRQYIPTRWSGAAHRLDASDGGPPFAD